MFDDGSIVTTMLVIWIASSCRIREVPVEIQESFGFSCLAQCGQHPPLAKSLKGLGSGVVELVEAFDGDAYRTVYTVRLETAIYVLHCFKKKSKSGIKTPQNEIDLVKRRLRDAEADYAKRQIGE